MIEKKLDRYEYMDLITLKVRLGRIHLPAHTLFIILQEDVYLVLSNAMLYNRPDTPYFRAAQKIKSQADRIFEEFEELRFAHPELPEDPAAVQESEPNSSRHPIGDLEPSLASLRPLFTQTSIADDINTVLETDPTTSLFSFEFPLPKPSPTPPPAKPKRDRKADRERARLERMTSSTVRTRTRSSLAAGEDDHLLPEDMDIGPAVQPNYDEQHDGHPDRKRKAKIVLPGQSDVLPVVDEVNNQDMFIKFDTGWILPDGSRRGGRAPVDRPLLEPKRKKAKTGRWFHYSDGV
jgi:hypothetical protein